MDENPYKAPADVDTNRNGIVRDCLRFFSRFQVQFFCWILAFIVSLTVLAIFQFVLLAKGLPAALLQAYFLDATYALLALWSFAGVLLKVYWIVIQRRKHRAQSLRLQRLNSGINPRLNIIYRQVLQKHYGERNRRADFRAAQEFRLYHPDLSRRPQQQQIRE